MDEKHVVAGMTALGILTLLFLGVIYGIGALVLMWAWNIVMPFLFHLPTITFWIALGIELLIGFVHQIFSISFSK